MRPHAGRGVILPAIRNHPATIRSITGRIGSSTARSKQPALKKMAKVQAPFMSISASGSIAGLLTARANTYGKIITKKPHPASPPSTAQLTERQRMRDARTGFKTLSSAERTLWQAVATARKRTRWVAFFAEWQFQNIAAGHMPLIPEPTL